MALADFDLEGKVAVVTGGSRGLGRAMARALARAGADVTIAARARGPLEEAAADLRETGRRILPLQVDVTDSRQCDEMVEQTVRELGGIHILVNNAGVVQEPGAGGTGGESPPLEISDEEWMLGINTNLSSAFYCTRAAARHMVEQRWGRVTMISSVAGVRGTRSSPIYSAAKAGMHALAKALAQNWARDNVNVNTIVVGSIPWRYVEGVGEATASQQRGGGPGSRIPVQRPGFPPELGPLVVYLSSDASSYVSGEVIVIDGGALEAAVAPAGLLFPGVATLEGGAL